MNTDEDPPVRYVWVRMPGGKRERFIDGGDVDLDEEVVLDSNGEWITEAGMEQWVREIEAQRTQRTVVRQIESG